MPCLGFRSGAGTWNRREPRQSPSGLLGYLPASQHVYLYSSLRGTNIPASILGRVGISYITWPVVRSAGAAHEQRARKRASRVGLQKHKSHPLKQSRFREYNRDLHVVSGLRLRAAIPTNPRMDFAGAPVPKRVARTCLSFDRPAALKFRTVRIIHSFVTVTGRRDQPFNFIDHAARSDAWR